LQGHVVKHEILVVMEYDEITFSSLFAGTCGETTSR